jgi:hypothetical protein
MKPPVCIWPTTLVNEKKFGLNNRIKGSLEARLSFEWFFLSIVYIYGPFFVHSLPTFVEPPVGI